MAQKNVSCIIIFGFKQYNETLCTILMGAIIYELMTSSLCSSYLLILRSLSAACTCRRERFISYADKNVFDDVQSLFQNCLLHSDLSSRRFSRADRINPHRRAPLRDYHVTAQSRTSTMAAIFAQSGTMTWCIDWGKVSDQIKSLHSGLGNDECSFQWIKQHNGARQCLSCLVCLDVPSGLLLVPPWLWTFGHCLPCPDCCALGPCWLIVSVSLDCILI